MTSLLCKKMHMTHTSTISEIKESGMEIREPTKVRLVEWNN